MCTRGTGFQTAQWKIIHLQCRRHRKGRFDPSVGKMSWRKKWQPTPAFLPGESHGQRSLVGHKELDRTDGQRTRGTTISLEQYFQYGEIIPTEYHLNSQQKKKLAK